MVDSLFHNKLSKGQMNIMTELEIQVLLIKIETTETIIKIALVSKPFLHENLLNMKYYYKRQTQVLPEDS